MQLAQAALHPGALVQAGLRFLDGLLDLHLALLQHRDFGQTGLDQLCGREQVLLFLDQPAALPLDFQERRLALLVLLAEALSHLVPVLEVAAGLLPGRIGGLDFGGALHLAGEMVPLGPALLQLALQGLVRLA